MAKQTLQIFCINKSDRLNPHERIVNVGGYANNAPWKISQQRCIEYIKNGDEFEFYVSVNGKSVWVVVATSRYGNEYIKTADDGDDENNLLSLPECP